MKLWRKVKEELGAGAHGTVHLAHPLTSSYDYPIAVKSAKYSCDASFPVQTLKNEAGILHHLAGAPNVVQCIGEDESLEENEPTYNLLLEYASLGTLGDLISRAGPMPELAVARFARMVLRGLAGIHSRGIAHCDLKPDNILVFPDEYGGIGELKIADFGLAVWDSDHFPACNKSDSVYGGHGYDCPCTDLHSMRNIIVEMIGSPKYLSPNGKDFLKCLEKEVVSRWSAGNLLEHPFIVGNLLHVDQTITHI